MGAPFRTHNRSKQTGAAISRCLSVGRVMSDIEPAHPEDHILRDIRRMVRHAFQIARYEKGIEGRLHSFRMHLHLFDHRLFDVALHPVDVVVAQKNFFGGGGIASNKSLESISDHR